MKTCIDKSALIAEIDKWKEDARKGLSDYAEGVCDTCEKVLLFIDTLEMKEVDLDADFGVYWGEYCDCDGNINDYEVAKHFFELGFKAQKGE